MITHFLLVLNVSTYISTSQKAIEGRRETKGNRITQGGDTGVIEHQERATGEREQGGCGKRNSPLPKGNGLLIYI